MKITQATLHQDVAIYNDRGAVVTGKSINGSKIPGATVTFDSDIQCLVIKVANKLTLVPAANVAIMTATAE